jgi:hypothetical protein
MNLRYLRSLVLDNLTLKVISFLLAFLLWVQIAGQQRVQRSVAVPVEFINMPLGLEITNDYPREVNVVISRPSSLRMDERQLTAVIDLSTAEPGSSVVPITERNIRNVPSGVQIEGIEQRRIRLEFERIRRKTVLVQPEVVGQPADGFQVREVRVIPSEVLVSGPESRLERITTAATEPIDVGGRSQGFRQKVYLDLEDTRLRIENASSVDVFIVIEEQRRIVRAKLLVRLLPEGTPARTVLRSADVVFSVPISYSSKVETRGFYAYATIPNEGAEKPAELPLSVAIPEEYQLVLRVESVDPPRAKITYPANR